MENPSVVGGMVEGFEIPCIVRYQDSLGLRTPLDQVGVSRVFTELVFRLNHVIAAFPEQALEILTDVFVEQNLPRAHCTGSLGFRDTSRTSANAALFSASSARISSM